MRIALALAGVATAATFVVAPVIAQNGRRGAAAAPAAAVARFTDIAAAAGVTFQHVNGATPERNLIEIMGSGGLFLDYDQDGWLDLVLVDGGAASDPAAAARARHRLFRNRGNGTFDDVTDRAGLVHRGYGMGACAGDYDNDGWTDLYITAVGVNTLFHNNRGTSFTDATATAGAGGAPVFSASCAFGDLDGDGDLDLFVTNYVDAHADNNIFCGDAAKKLRIYCHPLNFQPLADVLYRNEGNGTFTDISRQAGIAAQRGNGLGLVIGDYDDDGRPDVFVANDTTPNFLYHNEGGGRFAEVALPSGVAVASDGRPRAGMGTDLADYDGDGRLDLFVTNHELETHTLFRGLGQGLFEETTARTGIGVATLPLVGFGTAFVDYDHDADLDLAVVNGHVMNSPSHFRPGATEAQRKLLLRNDGSRFTDIGRTAGPGFATEQIGRMLASGDIDNDGDVDLLVTNNGGRAELLRNDTPRRGNSLLLHLIGTRANRSAVGARVTVAAGGRSQIREVKAGSSYLGQNDLRVHVGLGAATRADRIEVRWPGGATEVVTAVAANQIVTLTEGKGISARAPYR